MKKEMSLLAELGVNSHTLNVKELEHFYVLESSQGGQDNRVVVSMWREQGGWNDRKLLKEKMCIVKPLCSSTILPLSCLI